MVTNKTSLLAASAFFALTESILGFLLQTAPGEAVRILSYTSVVIACLFCTLFCERSKSYAFTQLGLICTVCADYFLVLAEKRQQLPAMLLFSVTQLAYFARLYFADGNKKRRTWHLICRGLASAIVILLTLLVLGDGADAVALVSMFYYVNLLTNIVFACLQRERSHVFVIGLLLFVCCDTLIGLSCLDAYLAIPEDSFIWSIIHPGFDLAWAFYVPSQTLLALSLLPERLKKCQ
ncbi:MAG: hypothetical protein IJX80_07920 [Clostridia bacterium]|nr:hypothetical protein [Clostridia bacterium]